jgi:CubicO group peptidase (beta-lactamase class C family)
MSFTMPSAAQITEAVQPLLGREGVSAVVGISIGNQSQLFFNGKGELKAVNGEALTLDGDTLFAIGSISKTFDATLYAFENPSASAVLGSYTPATASPVGSNYSDITLQSLATYSSGLPQDNDHPVLPEGQKKPYTVVEMYDFLAENPFPIHPTQGYAYSNLGFALLGAAVAVAAGSNGENYESLLALLITTPLGISFTTIDEVSSSLLPQSYAGNEPMGLGPNTVQYPAYDPAGGLVLSGNAFMTWMQFNMGLTGPANLLALLARTLTPSGVTTPASNDVCLAWFYSPKSNLLFKDGGTLGFSSLVNIMASPKPGTDASPAGVFIFVNQRHKNISKVMASIIDIVNGTTGTADVETPELGS